MSKTTSLLGVYLFYPLISVKCYCCHFIRIFSSDIGNIFKTGKFYIFYSLSLLYICYIRFEHLFLCHILMTCFSKCVYFFFQYL